MAQRTRNGSWAVRWREYTDDDQVVMRSKTFERKVDAEKFEAERTLGAIHNHDTSKMMTFADFAEVWYRDHCLVNKAKTQHMEDRRLIDNVLKPHFMRKRHSGDEPQLLQFITKKDLVELQSVLSHQKKLKPKTINNISSLARKIMQDATEWGYIPLNPFASARPLPVPEEPVLFWTFTEKKSFLDFCKRHDAPLWRVVNFVLNTGLRMGEVEGLYRDCLDFDRREITVRRNYNQKTKTLFEHTKGKRIRRVPMNDTVYELLKDAEALGPAERVFTDLGCFRLPRVAKRAGVTVLRYHGLRHTFASHMVMMGCTIFDLKNLLGHTDIKTTMRYAHLSQDSLKGATGLLDSSGVRPTVRFTQDNEGNQ